MTTSHLLYLHGFRSSPLSIKAQRMAAWIARHRPDVCWWCPQLPASPREAVRLIEGATAGWPAATTGVIGSSLGGFYATVLAERRGCRAVLLNPAIDPARDLTSHIGAQTGWYEPDCRFVFGAEDVDDLRALSPAAITRPARYMAVIAKGDEVLDWREMRARYAGARIELIEGGDHALSDFDAHLPEITRFLGLSAAN